MKTRSSPLIDNAARFPLENQDLLALAREKDDELFEAGLLHLAARWENSGRPEMAAQAYGEIRGPKAAQAQRRLEALNGGGSFGDRCEILLRGLARQSLEPSTLLALTVAGAAFSLTRGVAMARLAALPAHLLTRGAALPWLSGLAAFSVEAMLFPLASRAARSLLNPSQAAPDLGHEMQASFLALGTLRVFHGASQALLPANAGVFARFVPPIASIGGLMAVHRLEEQLGWRNSSDSGALLADSLALFLQFNIASRLSQAALGRGWRLQAAEWETRAQLARPDSLRPLWNPLPTLAVKSPKDFALAQEGLSDSPPPSVSSRPPRPVPPSESPLPSPREPAPSGVQHRPPPEDALKEFKAEAEHLAHDLNSGLMSLTYNLPILREWFSGVTELQNDMLRHYATGAGPMPAELKARVEDLYRSALPYLRRGNHEVDPRDFPPLEVQLQEVQQLSLRLMDSLGARVGELVEMAGSFRELAAQDKGLNLVRLDYALDEDFLRSHLGPATRLSYNPSERVFVAGPQNVLKRVFQNLLVNTREALEGHPFPIVKVQMDLANVHEQMLQQLLQAEYGFRPNPGIYWRIRVQDNGKGISEENLPRIFESGFSTKTPAAMLSRPISRGLGLAQVHKAVRERGGFVRVESALGGKGTAFEVYLPDIVSQHSEP